MTTSIAVNDIIDDRYKVTGTLGEGGMAIVYKGHDLISDKDVAIKVIKPDTATNKVNLNRFEREAQAAASLNNSNIVKVLNVGSYKGLPYMINEFVNGQNLRQILDIRGRFSFTEACDIMYQLCNAVEYAHNHQIIHRDIKPQNIFLTTNGIVKLGDFGVATFQSNTHVTINQNVVGSVHYVAPEVCSGKSASWASDIYSLGITFFELITGRVPFDAETPLMICIKQEREKFPNIKKFNSKTPEYIESIIYKATKKDPKERYETVSNMKKDISRAIQDPTLLEKRTSKIFSFFHPNSAIAKQRREERAERKENKKSK